MKKTITLLLLLSVTLAGFAQEDEYDEDAFDNYYDEILSTYGETRLNTINSLLSAISNGEIEEDPFSMAFVYLLKGRDESYEEPEKALATADELYENSSIYGSWTELPGVQGTARAYAYIIKGYVEWVNKKDKEMARLYFDSADYEYPNFYTYFYKGYMLHTDQDYKGALEYYEMADQEKISLHMDRASMYDNMGRIYASMKLSSKAIEAYGKAYDSHALCDYLYRWADASYYSPTVTDKEQAYEGFQLIVDQCQEGLKSTQVATSFSALANKYFNEGEYYTAGSYYGKAFDIDNNYYDAAYAASAFMALGQQDQAYSWASRSISAASGKSDLSRNAMGEAYFVRGYINLTKGNMSSAKSDLQNAKYYGHQQAAQFLTQYF